MVCISFYRTISRTNLNEPIHNMQQVPWPRTVLRGVASPQRKSSIDGSENEQGTNLINYSFPLFGDQSKSISDLQRMNDPLITFVSV